MIYVRQQFGEIDLLARIATPEAEINSLRQGFILLMTAFDAAIFDLVRVAFRQDFFGLIGTFGKQEKISFERIGKSKSFEACRDQVIEERLKGMYVKDLLFLFRSLGVITDDKIFARLVEIVFRRNVHIHNGGKVDERYLERDDKGVPKYNLDDLKVGEIARIDLNYWESAVELSDAFIDTLVGWSAERGNHS